MTDSAIRRVIEVSNEAYELLQRTAQRRGTDVAGAVDYLMEAPSVAAIKARQGDEDDE